ncbi:LLM class F420-dependent oxidoreductase [Desertibaculum subflavum]|uniref:LLM class F420-dependent oxidoreductase n=1 Tax=Desertibaculum subflavum TaxID=2268458 RepID=UPI000E66F092
MKLGMLVGYSGAEVKLPIEQILEAERLGFDSVWTAEAYGSDAVTPAAWILAQTRKIKAGTAIMQIPARQPSMVAMTAMTLDQLSGGRFMIGVGPSGPQVAEGWYGMPYPKPVTRTREYVEVIRKILAREDALNYQGECFHIPNTGPGTTGLGKPLKSILHGNPKIPIYTAAITHAGVRLAAEVADGFFPVWMNPERFDIFKPAIEEGFAKAPGKSLKNFDVAPFINCVMGDDLEACRNQVKQNLALYIGGMGARDKNFYNDYAIQLGYPDAAKQIQDLFLGGQKREAVAAVPDQLVDDVALVGPAARIKDRLGAWKAAHGQGHVGTMIVGVRTPAAARLLAEELL